MSVRPWLTCWAYVTPTARVAHCFPKDPPAHTGRSLCGSAYWTGPLRPMMDIARKRRCRLCVQYYTEEQQNETHA